MTKSQTAAAVALFAASLGLAAPASAGLVIQAGDYKMSFDNYDSGTVGYGSALGVVCSTVASCNSASTATATGSFGSNNPSADTMGIFSVSKIVRISDNALIYGYGQGGMYLTGVFGNLVDYNVTNNAGPLGSVSTTALSIGGMVDLYANSADYDPTHGAAVAAGIDLNKTGGGLYTGVSGGTLFLSGVFAAGGVAGDTTTTYSSRYNNVSLSGLGQGYIDLTGGSALPMFDSNGQQDLNGNFHDMFLTTSFDAASVNDTLNGWSVTATGQIKGTAVVPEPSSLALFAAGLFSMGVALRRRNG